MKYLSKTSKINPETGNRLITLVMTPTHYEDLVREVAWAQALDAAGVDNWSGYEYAQQYMDEEFGEENW